MMPGNEEHVVLVNAEGEDLIDGDGRIVTLEKLAAHLQGRRHRAISVFIFSSRGEVMLQQRAAHKYHCAGLWSNTCCTHPRPYEIPADAARRRLHEEMGLSCPVEEVFTFSYSADVGSGLIENEFDHVFFGFCDAPPAVNPDEAADWRWADIDALRTALAASPGQYAPWLRYCFPAVRKQYRKHRPEATRDPADGAGRDPVFDYLCVDDFLQDIVAARSLATALELGLIDRIGRHPGVTRKDLNSALRIDARGMALLLGLLKGNRVIEENDGRIRLTRLFEKAMAFRDLLEAKIAFAHVALPDFSRLFTPLIAAPDQFNRHAKIFEFFGYNRCSEGNPAARELTGRWMRITTALTKYESQVCLKHHEFSPYRRIMDIGGNSGEFMLRACRKYPDIEATVFDLPLVCDLGMAHVRREPEVSRITFVKGNALRDEFPGGHDLICFKSMLHDWPDKEAENFLAKASRSLRPGGTLLIFERGAIADENPPRSYSTIPLCLFFRCFRSPEWYAGHLRRLGFQNIRIEEIDMDMRFSLVTGTAAA